MRCTFSPIVSTVIVKEQEGQSTYNVTLRRVRVSLLLWKSDKPNLLVCVCMHACMWVCGRVGVSMRVRACSLVNPGRNAYKPYCDFTCGPAVCTIFFDSIS
jgi:hypothetical protein